MSRRGNGPSSYRAFQAMERGAARAMATQEKKIAKAAQKLTRSETGGDTQVRSFFRSNGTQVRSYTRKKKGGSLTESFKSVVRERGSWK